MRILIYCNTPLHLITAIHLKETYYSQDCVDLIVTDIMSGSRVLEKSLRDCGKFNALVHLEVKKTPWKARRYKFINRCKFSLLRKIFSEAGIDLDKLNCDEYIWANTGGTGLFLADYLKKHNIELKLSMIEDSFFTYSKDAEKQFTYALKNPLKQWLKQAYFSFFPTALQKLDRFYLFKPEYLEWDPHCKIERLKPIDRLNPRTLKLYNTIFGYYNMTDVYDQDFIFFEESYYEDGVPTGDTALLDKVADIVGKEHIMVKIHPRNSVNRFRQLGYKTNEQTYIPWEIIAMNAGTDGKTLLTMGSNSVIMQHLLFGIGNRVLFLFECLEDHSFLGDDYLKLLRKIHCQRPEIFLIPGSWAEAVKLLKESYPYG